MTDIPLSVRDAVLDRDNRRCRRCGREDNLTLHHIDKRSLSVGAEDLHRMDNLVTLCWMPCHALIEEHKIDVYVVNGHFFFTRRKI